MQRSAQVCSRGQALRLPVSSKRCGPTEFISSALWLDHLNDACRLSHHKDRVGGSAALWLGAELAFFD